MGTLPTAEGYLLGYDHIGKYDESRECATRAIQDGSSRLVHSRVSSTTMSEQTQSTPSLVDQDEQADQKEPVSKSYTNLMLGGSRNSFWRGHTKGGNSKISQLYKGKRWTPNPKRCSPPPTDWSNQSEQEN